MAVTKYVWINGIKVGYGTSVKVTPSIETEETPTFDGPVIDGANEPSHTITIDKLRYSTKAEYVQIEQLLMNMQTVGYPIKIQEKATFKDGKYWITDVVYDCKLDGNEYELKPDERTVESLSFKGTKRRRWIDGVEIKPTV